MSQGQIVRAIDMKTANSQDFPLQSLQIAAQRTPQQDQLVQLLHTAPLHSTLTD